MYQVNTFETIKNRLLSWRYRFWPAGGTFYQSKLNWWWTLIYLLAQILILIGIFLSERRLSDVTFQVISFNPYFKADQVSDGSFWVVLANSQIILAISQYVLIRLWHGPEGQIGAVWQVISLVQAVLMLIGIVFIFSLNVL